MNFKRAFALVLDFGLSHKQLSFILLHFAFLIFLLLFNQNNKTLILAFLTYSGLIFYTTRSLIKAIFYGFLLSIPFIEIGKTYEVLLIPAERLAPPLDPTEWSGYFINFIVSVKDIYIVAMLLYIVCFYKNLRLNKTNGLKLIFLFLFILFSFISSAFSIWPEVGYLFTIKEVSLIIILLFIWLELPTFKKDMFSQVVLLLFVLLAFESVMVIGQFVRQSSLGSSLESFSGINPFSAVDENAFYFRPYGTFHHANEVAMFIVWLILILIPFLADKFDQSQKMLLRGIIAMGIVALLLTLGRSAWISFVIGLLFYWQYFSREILNWLKTNQKQVWLLVALLGSLSIITLLPRIEKSMLSLFEGGSFYSRVSMFREAYKSMLLHPLFGTGVAQSTLVLLNDNPRGAMWDFPTVIHNGFIDYIVERGWPAFLFYLGFLYLSIKQALSGQPSKLKLAFVASMTAFFVNSFFQPFFSFGFPVIFSALLSLEEVEEKYGKKKQAV